MTERTSRAALTVENRRGVAQERNGIAPETWPSVGDEVVEFIPSDRGRGHGRGGRIERTTVKSVGKRDLKLDNGSRYRVGSTERRVGESWSAYTVYLLRPDDDRIAVAKRANRASNAYTAARSAADDFLRSRSIETATLLRSALDKFIEAQKWADRDA